MIEPREGYLGATARIRSGPAPEMVRAGYELESADGPLLHRGFTLADLAHVTVLRDLGVIPPADAEAVLGAVRGLDEAPLDPLLGDAYNARERVLETQVGNAAGWLAAGRPRREAGRIAFRIALRGRVLDLTAAVARFAAALTDQAERHAATLMADYTYLQAAQVSTFGHYLLSFAYPALRDGARLRTAYEWVNASPAGVGGVAGSRFPTDRRRLAELLGFDGIVAHTRDAMWQTDGLVDLLNGASLAVTNASRLAEDLEIYASAEFGLVRIGDAFCRASVLMPQKRNPYALAVIRGGAGTLLGRAVGLAATQRTPSARTDNLLYAYAEVCNAVDSAAGLVDLAAAVTESLEPDEAAMARAASDGWAQAADLSEVLCRERGLDYRSAYRIVGRAVADAIALGRGPDALDPAALGLSAEALADALDPAAALVTRTVPGGAAPGPMADMLAAVRDELRGLRAWIERRRSAIADAEAALLSDEEERAGGVGSRELKRPGAGGH